MIKIFFLLTFIVLFCSAFLNSLKSEADEPISFSLRSAVFKDEGKIPKKYTCDGEDVSPPLSWSGVPDGTKSYVVIMEDPDAPGGVFTHWVLYDLPASLTNLSEGVEKKVDLKGPKQGVNDFGRVGYGGPCPPEGSTHRYIFRLYALDTPGLNLKGESTKEEVLKIIKNQVLSETSLTGIYGR
jgi:Raf kinase inhibitor-like YbhB/YbcL family protein